MSGRSRQAGHSLLELLVVLAVVALVVPAGLEIWVRGMSMQAGLLERREEAMAWRRMAGSLQKVVDERVRVTAEGASAVAVSGEAGEGGLYLNVLEIEYIDADGAIRRWRLWEEQGQWWWRPGAGPSATAVRYAGRLWMRVEGAVDLWVDGNGRGDWWLETVADCGREAVAIRWGK